MSGEAEAAASAPLRATPQPSRATWRSNRPTLLLMTSSRSGHCRRVEGFVAAILAERKNHRTFDVRSIPVEERPETHDRLRVSALPTLLVVEDRTVVARLDGAQKKDEIGRLLAPWLHGGYTARNRQPGGRRSVVSDRSEPQG